MPRIARIVVPGLVHHVTHRGNRSGNLFFTAEDRTVYRRWLAEYSARYEMEVWAYCLMSNHVHLLVVGQREDSMSSAIGRTHMRFARWINQRQGWSGHLWQNRFFSTPLDHDRLWRAVRYVERNPVRAGIVGRAEDYLWSSARCHCNGVDDALLADSRPFPGPIADWSAWLSEGLEPEVLAELRRNTSAGRPTGSRAFAARLEERSGRVPQEVQGTG